MHSRRSFLAPRPVARCFGTALLLLALLHPAAAARQPLAVNASAAAAPKAGQSQFDSVFTAAVSMNETRRLRDAFTAIGSKGLSPELVAEYQGSLGIIQDGSANITALFPNELAWQRQAAMLCMSVPEMMAYLQAHPRTGADGILAFIFNGTLMSKDFKEGMVLESLKPGFNVTLRRRNNTDGSTTWYLPAASPNASSVDVLTPDITAGSGVVHLTTNFAVDSPLRAQSQQIRASQGDNCTLYSNTSGVDSGLDVPGFGRDVEAKAGGGALAAAAAAAPAAATGSAGVVCVWGRGGMSLWWRLVFMAAVWVVCG